MKKTYYIALVLIAAITFKCSDSMGPADYPPEAPTGLYSITGDNEVILYWDHNFEADVYEYGVYTCDIEDGVYELDGTTEDNSYTLYLANGVTKYLAVAAMDYGGNESDLSYETVWDTPRPEGHNLTVYALFYDEFDTNWERCGLDLSDYDDYMIQDIDNTSNDIFIDNFEGTLFLNAFADDTDIAMVGRTYDLSDVDYVDPDDVQWDEEGYLPLYEDHSYIIWTHDNHFATIRVKEVYEDRVRIDWAFQTDPGNPQLKTSSKMNLELNRVLRFKRADGLTEEIKAIKRGKIDKLKLNH
ncbi:MAG: hypothetical protein GY863_20700 [bacterium]|nr:hypothetical protein [bacterium]